MLILSRRLQESVSIDSDIEVTVLSIDQNQVKIGINAPRSVKILREEIKDRPGNNRPTLRLRKSRPDSSQKA